jgi:SAM-dependent methyltransferase
MDPREIDWNVLWQEGRRRKSWRARNASEWDDRVSSFARRDHSAFVCQLLAIMRPAPDWDVLDVGSGAGTMALPLARLVKRVTALDFSAGMLEELRRQAARQGIDNIDIRRLAWEEEWRAAGLAPHQVALACRSLTVNDLRAALEKLDRWATRLVFLVDRVGPGPFDPDLFAALGREFVPGPDYIYTYNLLYQMGIQARIDFITLDSGMPHADKQEAASSCLWQLGEMTSGEEEGLEAYLAERLEPLADGRLLLRRRLPVRWAVIWWEK